VDDFQSLSEDSNSLLLFTILSSHSNHKLEWLDKMVKSNKLLESSDKLWKSSTFSPDKIHLRFYLKQSYKVEPERIQQELDQEVPLEDKLSMFLHLEESTKLSILCARDQENLASDPTKP
jgi:hypothetical protein